MARHNAGKLKQTNKKHKGSSSKREIKNSFGAGKVASRVGKRTSIKTIAQDNRQNRINKAKQLQKAKRTNIWLQKRIGSSNGPPKVIGIVPLCIDANGRSLINDLLNESSWNSDDKSNENSKLYHALYNKYKARSTFLLADFEMQSALEVARLADILVLVVHSGPGFGPEHIIDPIGAAILSAIKAMGLPHCLACVQGLDDFSGHKQGVKAYTEARRLVQRCIDDSVYSGVKLLEHAPDGSELSRKGGADEILRSVLAAPVKDLTWRSIRSCLLADAVEVGDGAEECSVRVSGYLRGCPMRLHSLMHIAGVGTGRIVSVSGCGRGPLENAARMLRRNNQQQDDNTAALQTVLADPNKQDGLVLEASADVLMGEQTWPSEEEIAAATGEMDPGAGRHRRNIPSNVIPAGMSSYQADWFVDEDGEFEDTNEGDKNSDADMNEEMENDMPPPVGRGVGGVQAMDADDDDMDDMTLDGSVLDAPVRGGQLQDKRKRQAQEDDEFPDEVDTPEDVAARVRFARYRALQSFRTSPWHPKENLPTEYSRIYEFESFSATQRGELARCRAVQKLQDNSSLTEQHNKVSGSRSRSQSRADTEEVMEMHDEEETKEAMALLVRGTDDYIKSGQYVTIELSNIPASKLAQQLATGNNFLGVFSLLQHENKLSVLHFTIQRCGDYDGPIKSKDELIFQASFREFEGKAVFSEANLNCDKHKMERFLKRDRISVASVYGPITYMPSPVLIYKRDPDDGSLQLVATGSLGSVDPDRIVLKKVVLTGFPIRVRKRSAVVRHLFYDPQDVRWFKPAELVTKYGIRGHIKEPVGTHGLLKAHFSAPIKQNDTVMLILYKRVFPKFPEAGSVLCR